MIAKITFMLKLYNLGTIGTKCKFLHNMSIITGCRDEMLHNIVIQYKLLCCVIIIICVCIHSVGQVDRSKLCDCDKYQYVHNNDHNIHII